MFVTRGTDSDFLVGFVLALQAWQSGDLKSVRYESHPQIKLNAYNGLSGVTKETQQSSQEEQSTFGAMRVPETVTRSGSAGCISAESSECLSRMVRNLEDAEDNLQTSSAKRIVPAPRKTSRYSRNGCIPINVLRSTQSPFIALSYLVLCARCGTPRWL
jgi:hypothetical protein